MDGAFVVLPRAVSDCDSRSKLRKFWGKPTTIEEDRRSKVQQRRIKEALERQSSESFEYEVCGTNATDRPVLSFVRLRRTKKGGT